MNCDLGNGNQAVLRERKPAGNVSIAKPVTQQPSDASLNETIATTSSTTTSRPSVPPSEITSTQLESDDTGKTESVTETKTDQLPVTTQITTTRCPQANTELPVVSRKANTMTTTPSPTTPAPSVPTSTPTTSTTTT